MSTRNLRKRKVSVDPMLQDQKVEIKTELEDVHPYAPQQETTVKRTKHKNTSKVKAKVKDEIQANNVKDVTCKYCQQIFESPMERLRHSRTCQDFPMVLLPSNEIEKYFDSPDMTQCPICFKPLITYNWRSKYIQHLITHTIGVNHQCSICKKIFRRREGMLEHEKRHIVSA